MNHQLELGYLVIQVPEPESLTPVFSDIVGLVPGEPTSPGTLAWRDDARAYRVIVEPGPANDAVTLGFEAADTDAFDSTVSRLSQAGFEVVEDTGAAEDRLVARLARTTTPLGVDAEIVLALADAPSPFSSALVPGGFLTEGVGFGHVVFATMAFDESATFLTEGLGFVQSDWLEMEIAPGITLEVRFYHCNARHHTVALARAPFEMPQVLHHVMFEANERDDVGAAFDRLWASELGIPNGLGRHDNDGMFSFYLQTPAGFQIEFGHGARVITEGWDDNRAYDAISAWGHQALRQA
ncbi:MAG TPA: VOC family protein [Acidimicrobiales bacterium]|jgi:2,3-dihydroxybiphenyl 1,2-dioxygenase|nr:VOC family protein [Acidimicrobiales bacterium]